MKLVIGPIDVVGNLWVIRPGEGPTAIDDERWQCARSAVELRVSRPSSTLEASIAGALSEGRAVSVFDRARRFAARLDRLATHLSDLELTAEWEWTDALTSSVRIDEERDALGWFVQHPCEMLFVDPVAYEKRRRLSSPRPRFRFGRERSGVHAAISAARN
jgi:hypothetical protein